MVSRSQRIHAVAATTSTTCQIPQEKCHPDRLPASRVQRRPDRPRRPGRTVPARAAVTWHGVPVANLTGSAKLLRAMNSSAALSLLFERGRLTRGELRDATRPVEADRVRGAASARRGRPGRTGGLCPRSRPGRTRDLRGLTPRTSPGRGYLGPRRSRAIRAVRPRPGVTSPARSTATSESGGPTPARSGRIRVSSAARRFSRGAERLARCNLASTRLVRPPPARTMRRLDLPGFNAPGLVDDLAELIGIPVGVDNDVDLAAIAEHRHGSAAGADGLVLLWSLAKVSASASIWVARCCVARRGPRRNRLPTAASGRHRLAENGSSAGLRYGHSRPETRPSRGANRGGGGGERRR